MDADAGILKAIEHGHRHFLTETVPKLKPVERLRWSLRLVAKRMKRQAPDEGAVLSQNMKAERAALDRCGAKDAYMDELAVMRLAVVEEFFA